MTWLALACGGFTWTLLEYLLHRFVFHERLLGVTPAREHLEHHAKVDWFAPFGPKLLLAAIVLPALSLVAVPLAGWAPGLVFVGGVVGGWLAYEGLHRAIHVWPPHTAYGRWARRHHLYHHFGDPRRNHGVSSPLWDFVFRTFTPVSTVTVPARSARKLPWLLDGDAVHPTLAGTYVLAPARTAP
ncbi:MAG: sterol desaturase family protein [Pseudomonadota bacterium]|nr:sterol desaturase family protein [Pseudomonadota bacterium]